MATNPAFETIVCPHSDGATAKAAALILAGHCVAVPTETVYGLAADATNPDAVACIYAAKGRPAFNPLIVHIRDLAHAETLAHFCDAARALAAAHWPGPLTLVLPARQGNGIARLATAGLATIALRMPNHPTMRDLLFSSMRPLAAPSANASGTISPTRAAHVLRSLDGRIPMIIDGGASAMGLESTIVAVDSGGAIRQLRPGPICVGLETSAAAEIESPGQLESHYAPSKPLRLNARAPNSGEWLIGFGEISGDDTLSRAGNPNEAAARLFDCLHAADLSDANAIAVAPIPAVGIGAAINDRLKRAAA
jgi:L-threonylcarbamoyladenylate synthase